MSGSNITEEKLKEEIEKILKNANLDDTSSKKVRQKLEKKLKTDLSEEKKVIDRLVMEYVDSLESADEDAQDSDDNKEKKKAKTSDVDDDDDEEMPTVKKEDEEEFEVGRRRTRQTADKKKKAPAKGKKGGVSKRGGKGNGYTRAYKLSPALSELLGETELPRHEVVKRVWAIIKERQLLDPKNRQFAICDKPLYKVIGTQRFYTFGMMKYLKNHFIDE